MTSTLRATLRRTARLPNDLQPCAATASIFAYAQNNLIICCHNNPLEADRVFAGHLAKIDLLVADAHKWYSASETVFSYDELEVGIFWDMLTGNEIARFASCEALTAAAWMNNGKIAFGFTTGMITLFELSSAEQVSIGSIDKSISALSPASDGDKFAIGYRDGTILIVRLAPRFTILNQLTMPTGASPIVALSWHRSFDVLAVQNGRGDLCCWHTTTVPPRLTRRLKPLAETTRGANWMEWSKNGRIVQFFNPKAPLALRDVRTKQLKFKTLRMSESIKGLAIYSPDARLFVLGAKHNIHQIKLEPNLELVATTRAHRGANPVFARSFGASAGSRMQLGQDDEPGADSSSDDDSEACWSEKHSIGATSASSVIDAEITLLYQRDSTSSISLKSDVDSDPYHGLQQPHERDIDESDPSVTDGMSSIGQPESMPISPGEAVAEFLALEFLKDEELLKLYQDAVRHMDERRFVCSHTRLMKSYFLDLESEVKTSEQKTALGIPLPSSELIRMSSDIYDIVVLLGAKSLKKNRMMGEQETDSMLLLYRVLDEHDTDVDDAIGDANVKHHTCAEEDEVSRQTRRGTFSKLETVAELLTVGLPFESYKRKLRNFLHSPPAIVINRRLEKAAPGKRSHSPAGTSDAVNYSAEESQTFEATENAALAEHLPEPKRSFGQRFVDSTKRMFSRLSLLANVARPRLRDGYRRIEWICDCGVKLYADFRVQDTEQLESLIRSLKNPIQLGIVQSESNSHRSQNTHTPGEGGKTIPVGGGQHDTQSSSNGSDSDTSSSTLGSPSLQGTPVPSPTTTVSSSGGSSADIQSPRSKSKFLALCVNTGGIYKTLAEVDLTGIESDTAAFLKMKEAYTGTRGLRSRLSFLIKPVGLEFVQFTLWNRKNGYVSICNRPESIPPHTMSDYEYVPKPLQPLPPMPPEIFIHYLEHGEGELNATRHDWLPRLPVRLDNRVIDGDEACYGYGVHIIEGPNRIAIFWIFMTTMAASILACVLWSALNKDIQGGTSLGALIVALPASILAAFLFRVEGM